MVFNHVRGRSSETEPAKVRKRSKSTTALIMASSVVTVGLAGGIAGGAIMGGVDGFDVARGKVSASESSSAAFAASSSSHTEVNFEEARGQHVKLGTPLDAAVARGGVVVDGCGPCAAAAGGGQLGIVGGSAFGQLGLLQGGEGRVVRQFDIGGETRDVELNLEGLQQQVIVSGGQVAGGDTVTAGVVAAAMATENCAASEQVVAAGMAERRVAVQHLGQQEMSGAVTASGERVLKYAASAPTASTHREVFVVPGKEQLVYIPAVVKHPGHKTTLDTKTTDFIEELTTMQIRQRPVREIEKVVTLEREKFQADGSSVFVRADQVDEQNLIVKIDPKHAVSGGIREIGQAVTRAGVIEHGEVGGSIELTGSEAAAKAVEFQQTRGTVSGHITGTNVVAGAVSGASAFSNVSEASGFMESDGFVESDGYLDAFDGTRSTATIGSAADFAGLAPYGRRIPRRYPGMQRMTPYPQFRPAATCVQPNVVWNPYNACGFKYMPLRFAPRRRVVLGGVNYPMARSFVLPNTVLPFTGLKNNMYGGIMNARLANGRCSPGIAFSRAGPYAGAGAFATGPQGPFAVRC